MVIGVEKENLAYKIKKCEGEGEGKEERKDRWLKV